MEAFQRHRLQLLDNITVHIDNANVLRGIQRITQGWKPGPETPDGDLWKGIQEATPKNLKEGNFKKIDSHLSKEEAIQKGFTEEGWKANQAADQLAEEGARRNKLWEPDVEIQQKLDRTTQQVLRRMVQVHRIILQEKDAHPEQKDRYAKHSKNARVKEVAEQGKAMGHELTITDRVRCQKCHQSSGITKCWRWVHSPCNSEQQHQLRTHHGLTFCQKCGHWDAKEGKSSRGLQGPCKPKEVPPFRRKTLNRLLMKDPQPPRGPGGRTAPHGA